MALISYRSDNRRGESSSCGSSQQSNLTLITLPEVVQDNIFSFLSYDEIARERTVSQLFNLNGQRHLNKGFTRLQEDQKALYKVIKNRLPRRESERHNHALSRHMEVLTSVGTRLCLLEMTYGKYIKDQTCCFIPGKVLDEANRLLQLVNKEATLPRSYDIIQELRDISGMAMEHFEENIIPRIKTQRFTGLMPTSACDTLRRITWRLPTSLPDSTATYEPQQPGPSLSRSLSLGIAGSCGQSAWGSGVRLRGRSCSLMAAPHTCAAQELKTCKQQLHAVTGRCGKLEALLRAHKNKWMRQARHNSELRHKWLEQKKVSESLAARLCHVETLVEMSATIPGTSPPPAPTAVTSSRRANKHSPGTSTDETYHPHNMSVKIQKDVKKNDVGDDSHQRSKKRKVESRD